MKKIIAGIMALTICGGVIAPMSNCNFTESSFTACAEEEEYTEGEYAGILCYQKYKDYVKIIACDTHFKGGGKIPAVIEGLPVREIDDRAFEECVYVTSVIIPESVKRIGYSAFVGCENLRSVTLPQSLEVINAYAFESCKALKTITIPSGVTEIGEAAFDRCYNLKSIEVASDNKFYTSEDGILFSKDKSVIVEFPEGKNDTTYTVPDGVKEISNNCFSNCDKLTTVKLPDSLKSINGDAFYNCLKLTSVKLPNGLEKINFDAFFNCYSLTDMTIPESVIIIESDAFGYCDAMNSITIKNPKCELGENAIYTAFYDDLSTTYYTGTIYGYEGSTAQAYAKEHGITFKVYVLKPTEPTTEKPTEAPTGKPTEKPTDTPTTKPTEKPTTKPTKPSTEISAVILGDVSGDETVDASDASMVLVEYAAVSTGGASTFGEAQKAAADTNKDGTIDASDASQILMFYAYTSTGGTIGDMEEWSNNA